MPNIHVLSPHIANQIAAGEVVERPGSVVKELVENALDAGATAVSIEIQDGGTAMIRVCDNGSGISGEDCETAFLRHATSKIGSAEDLAAIHSLGFRGEALASIAAVSKVTMTTRTAHEDAGTRVVVEGGQVRSRQAVGCTEGTTMEVSSLFYNTPARLKFLKNPRTEAGYAGDLVARMILNRPDVAFHYINNGKSVYQTYGDGSLINAIACIYGTSVLPFLREVAFDDGYLKIAGFVGTSELSRPNRTSQSIFLNGRCIRSNALSYALQTAFDTRLMSGRFPFAVLALRIAYAEVDVNVHPTKLEVRFIDEKRVSRAVTAACARALINPVPSQEYVPSADEKLQNGNARCTVKPLPQTPHTSQSLSEQQAVHVERIEPSHITDKAVADAKPSFSGIRNKLDESPSKTEQINLRVPLERSGYTVREGGYTAHPISVPASDEKNSTLQRYEIHKKTSANADNVPVPVHGEQTRFFEAPYHVCGVLFDTYWIVQQEDNIYLIDQHAAHERQLYELLMAREEPFVSQQLLFSREWKLQPVDYAVFLSNQEALTSLGYRFIDHNDGGSIAILAVPQADGLAFDDRFFFDALHHLDEMRETTASSIKRGMLIQSACKHAVKAGEPITETEIEELLKLFASQGIPMTCPHGRPVAVRITKLELEKMFKRVL